MGLYSALLSTCLRFLNGNKFASLYTTNFDGIRYHKLDPIWHLLLIRYHEDITMVLQIDTVIGNERPSKELTRLLEDLANTVYLSYKDIEVKMEKVKAQAQAEDFSKQETIGLVKQYLKKISLTNNQIKWLTYLKPRIMEQKKLREEQVLNYSDANMPMANPKPETVNIPTYYKVVVPDQVLEETKQFEQEQEQSEVFETHKPEPNYEVENLRLELDNAKNKITELTTQNKLWEEKYKQSAKTRTLPAVQGNILRTKIVVNQLFREILPLKGARVIYANIVIETSRNKYIKLDPL
jgi:hypothetical protein